MEFRFNPSILSGIFDVISKTLIKLSAQLTLVLTNEI